MISRNDLGNLIFPAKTVKQVAVLPFVVIGDEAKVLLLTSRRRGRWILPKGWPEKNLPLNATAMTEAMEEAGLAGQVADRAIGTYTYKKRMKGGYEVTSHVSVFPMLVSHHFLDWPEKDERKFQWCSLKKAQKRLDDPGAAKLIGSLRTQSLDYLYAFFEDSSEKPVASNAPATSPSFVRTLANMVGL
ncbi:NUDIX hydrolase [Hwanghaeella grinnelliae]|uniref:NUDIX hydrolase n=1 Tax=Hwanghaeella grinnelliae TaxID=2500179 RepID=A0A3S2Z640_9PROT|nr:NUDIX hydrolase [Hwanghaeella grinnelliae]RVU35003.1 NUDIX hydrolase [Hwanghaeella grinnelliae]